MSTTSGSSHDHEDDDEKGGATAAAAATHDNDDDDGDEKEEEDSESEEGEDSEMRAGVPRDTSAIDRAEVKVRANQYDYGAHVEYIKALKEYSNDWEALTNARNAFSALFPLTADMWLEWINDEERIASPEEHPRIETLYRRALSDYLSVPVAVRFCKFAAKNYDYAKARDIFEFALSLLGLHVMEAGKLWKTYIRFEKSSIEAAKEEPQKDTCNLQKQGLDKISKLYQRQLSVPLIGMDDVLIKYLKWAEKYHVDIPTTFQRSYEKALESLKIRLVREEKISDSGTTSNPDYTKLDDWKKYISFEEKENQPQRVIMLYERALSIYVLVSELWLSYGAFTERTFTSTSIPSAVFSRGTRNCPSCGGVWAGTLRCQEKSKKSLEDVETTLKQALLAGLASHLEFLCVLNQYLDIYRRALNGTAQSFQNFRSACDKAASVMNQYYPSQGYDADILRFWAKIEAHHFNNIERCRELWESIIKYHSDETTFWLEYASLERKFDESKTRNIYKRGAQAVHTFPEPLLSAWLEFERECGTLEMWTHAKLTYDTKMKQFLTQQRKEQKKLEKVAAKEAAKEQKKQDRRNKRRPQSLQKASKGEDDEMAEIPQSKRPRTDPKTEEEKNSHKIFVSNLRFSITEEDLEKLFSKYGTVVTIRHNAARGFAFIEYENTKSADAATELDGQVVGGRKLNVKHAEANPTRLTKHDDLSAIKTTPTDESHVPVSTEAKKPEEPTATTQTPAAPSDKPVTTTKYSANSEAQTASSTKPAEEPNPEPKMRQRRMPPRFVAAGTHVDEKGMDEDKDRDTSSDISSSRRGLGFSGRGMGRGRGRPPAEAEQEAQRTPGQGRGRGFFGAGRRVEYSAERESRTLFVTYLDYKADEMTVKTHFAETCGEDKIVEARVVRDPVGRSKGFAYVEFVNVEAAQEGLALDKTMILSRPICVRWSRPRPSQQHTTATVNSMDDSEPASGTAETESKKPLMIPRALALKKMHTSATTPPKGTTVTTDPPSKSSGDS
ncbi:proton-associated sugar transporter A [Pelomyxa schiedti]|nr:proton-associated sugar transporter A [Pelomyxa schiedti]